MVLMAFDVLVGVIHKRGYRLVPDGDGFWVECCREPSKDEPMIKLIKLHRKVISDHFGIS